MSSCPWRFRNSLSNISCLLRERSYSLPSHTFWVDSSSPIPPCRSSMACLSVGCPAPRGGCAVTNIKTKSYAIISNNSTSSRPERSGAERPLYLPLFLPLRVLQSGSQQAKTHLLTDTGELLYRLLFNNCSACFMLVSVSFAPLSIRAISCVRSLSSMRRTSVCVRPRFSVFSIRKCWSPNAAI